MDDDDQNVDDQNVDDQNVDNSDENPVYEDVDPNKNAYDDFRTQVNLQMTNFADQLASINEAITNLKGLAFQAAVSSPGDRTEMAGSVGTPTNVKIEDLFTGR